MYYKQTHSNNNVVCVRHLRSLIRDINISHTYIIIYCLLDFHGYGLIYFQYTQRLKPTQIRFNEPYYNRVHKI